MTKSRQRKNGKKNHDLWKKPTQGEKANGSLRTVNGKLYKYDPDDGKEGSWILIQQKSTAGPPPPAPSPVAATAAAPATNLKVPKKDQEISNDKQAQKEEEDDEFIKQAIQQSLAIQQHEEEDDLALALTLSQLDTCMTTVYLVSKEGDSFPVPKEAVATISGWIESMMVDHDEDENDGEMEMEIPLLHVNGEVLRKVVDFCIHHLEEPMTTETIQLPTREKIENFDKVVQQQWYSDFIDDLKHVMLFELLLAANYMDIKPLLDLACAKIAFIIKGKTFEKVCKIFNIWLAEEATISVPPRESKHRDSFESLADYCDHVSTSDEYRQEDVERLFPELLTMSRVFPLLEKTLGLASSMPWETYLKITEYSATPVYRLKKSYESTDYRISGVARSEQPLYHMQYFQSRYHAIDPQLRDVDWKIGIAGIGFTLNPKGTTGLRFNNESCGFDIDRSRFFVGEHCSIGIQDHVYRLPRTNATWNIMELAIDYVNQQVLVKWPGRGGDEPIRLDLPEHMQNRLLFPLVFSRGMAQRNP